jgi:cytochrome b-561
MQPVNRAAATAAPTIAPTPRPSAAPAPPGLPGDAPLPSPSLADTAPEQRGWIDRRIDTRGINRRYGRKVFPVHSTFFFGEMALFSFVILVLTGIYLGLLYVPSNADVVVNGQTLPAAYASVQLIESIPIANVLRNVHHWGAHLMVASVVLHLIRIFFTGAYRFPRELNWLIGMVLLGLTLVSGFVGYALPYDSYAVTATGIGYGIARSIPWLGHFVAELFFGGVFPTLGSLPRLYTIHIFVLPALILLATTAHMLIIIKQKHTQPGYAKPIAEPGKVLGVPFWPYQGLLAGQLFLLMFAGLFLLSAVAPVHPLEAYGPPGAAAADVKPDWYLMWVYGFLKLIPAEAQVRVLGANIGPEFLGGVLFPTLLIGLVTAAPWLDRSNRAVGRQFEYLEPVTQAATRFAVGIGVLVFLGMTFVAAYYDNLGIPLGLMWGLLFAVPLVVAGLAWALAKRLWRDRPRFDPSVSADPLGRPLAKGQRAVAASGDD